jgi:peptidoglycan/xylan/chitin deacetylase (PgdA/CDA1 family)
VFVATGLAFPDGLTGGAAAAVRDGPVLLVRPDSIPPATAAQLQRLAPSRVVIVGGTGVISGAVEANLRAYATTVQRAAGADRYGTALAVSQATFAGVASAVFIASGANFPDALGAIPAAGQRLGPVLLVPSATLPSAISAELARLDPDVVFLLGGESVVAPLVAKLVQKRLGACWSGQKPGAGAQQIFSRIPNAPNQVALTFDMGGRLDPALSIVQFLIDNQVCTTIFPTGAMSQSPVGQQVLALIRAHPELFELGNHTMHHCDLVRGGAGSPTTAPCSTGGAPSADFIRRQMTDAAAILKAGTGMDPVPYWRPPYGSYNQAVLNAVASVGYTKTFMWDIDTIDWKPTSQGGPTAAQIAAKVVNNAVSGSNVLMHLGGYETLGALPTMVSGLRSRGFTTTSLSDMLDG